MADNSAPATAVAAEAAEPIVPDHAAAAGGDSYPDGAEEAFAMDDYVGTGEEGADGNGLMGAINQAEAVTAAATGQPDPPAPQWVNFEFGGL